MYEGSFVYDLIQNWKIPEMQSVSDEEKQFACGKLYVRGTRELQN
jgi:hypothetical protein